MRYRILGLIVAFSLSCGMVKAEGFPIEDGNRLLTGASRNYRELVNNDDATVTILDPKFSSPDGYPQKLSTRSDLNGVCKLFGYGPSVIGGSIFGPSLFDRTSVIDSAGRFASYALLGESNNPMIFSLICKSATVSPPSTRYDRMIQNDDGTVTILDPKFGSPDGFPQKLSTRSDLNGVCKLFGYGPAVIGGSIFGFSQFYHTSVIGSEGRFASYALLGESNNPVIVSLICESATVSPPSARYDRMIQNDD